MGAAEVSAAALPTVVPLLILPWLVWWLTRLLLGCLDHVGGGPGSSALPTELEALGGWVAGGDCKRPQRAGLGDGGPSQEARMEPEAAASSGPTGEAGVEPEAAAHGGPTGGAGVEPEAAAHGGPTGGAGVEPEAAAYGGPTGGAGVEPEAAAHGCQSQLPNTTAQPCLPLPAPSALALSAMHLPTPLLESATALLAALQCAAAAAWWLLQLVGLHPA